MNDAIHFEGTVSPDIFCEAQRLHTRRSSIIFVLGMSAAAALIGITNWISGDVNVISVAILVCGVSSLLIHFGLRQFRWRRMYERTPYLRDKIYGTISRESYLAGSAVGSSDVPWSKFVKVLYDDDIVLLYRGPNLFHVMAQEFFASADDWRTARSIALEIGGHS